MKFQFIHLNFTSVLRFLSHVNLDNTPVFLIQLQDQIFHKIELFSMDVTENREGKQFSKEVLELFQFSNFT
jgi:hypothetical protein